MSFQTKQCTSYTDLDKDGWAIFPSTNASSKIGFIKLERDLLDHKKGEYIPYGKYNTLCIMETRNAVLSDTSLNLPIPQKTENITENVDLTNAMNAASTSMGSGAASLYFPICSRSYAYEPTGNKNLKEEYKAHNWFLPTLGELQRLLFLIKKDSDITALKQIVEAGILTSPSSWIWTSTEQGSNRIYTINASSLSISYYAKNYSNYKARFICAF